jgi:hypothetical protein
MHFRICVVEKISNVSVIKKKRIKFMCIGLKKLKLQCSHVIQTVEVHRFCET